MLPTPVLSMPMLSVPAPCTHPFYVITPIMSICVTAPSRPPCPLPSHPKDSKGDDQQPDEIADAQTDLVFRLSNDEGKFDVAVREEDDQVPRGARCVPGGVAPESRGPAPAMHQEGQAVQAVGVEARGLHGGVGGVGGCANEEGARAINYIAANADAFRKSEGVDSRQDFDEKMAKPPVRERDSFWHSCLCRSSAGQVQIRRSTRCRSPASTAAASIRRFGGVAALHWRPTSAPSS